MQLVSFSVAWYVYVIYGLVLLAFSILVWRGSIWHNGLFSSLLLITVVINGAGWLFYVMHWSLSTLLLIISGLLIMVIYSFWFRRKKAKQRLDYLKLLWVVSAGLFSIAVGSHMQTGLGIMPVRALLSISFWTLLLDFLYTTYIRPKRVANN